MNTFKHKLTAFALLLTSVLFAQKYDKKVSETFNVNSDVVVEISTRHADVTIETWNKNVVSVEGEWQVEVENKEKANGLFNDVDFEALGNKKKVVIKANSSHHNLLFVNGIDNFDFHFNFDSIANLSNSFSHNFHFEFPEAPEVPELAEELELPEMPEMPHMVISHLSKIEFDHEAYEKDKEGYMKKFKKQQEEWKNEMEQRIEPQMKEFEKKMKLWEKEHAPKMKEFEEKMAKWHKENEPKMKEFEKKMAKWHKENEPKMKEFELKMAEIGKKMEKKYDSLLEFKHENHSHKPKVEKKILIKVPKNAKVKLDIRHGSYTGPNDLHTVD